MSAVNNALGVIDENPMVARNDSAFQLVNKQKVAKGFDNAALNYDSLASVQGEISNYGLMRIENLDLNKVGSLLDIGCGTASSFTRLQALAERVIGVDISLNMLNQASKSNKAHESCQFNPINGDAENLPFQSNSIDTVYSSMAFQWCESPLKALSEVHRVLKPSGNALLCIMTGESFNDLQRGWQHIGLPSRINEFHSIDAWKASAESLNWSVDTNTKQFSSSHKSLFDMLSSIKRIGANTKLDNAYTELAIDEARCASSNYMSKHERKGLTQYLNTCNSENESLTLDYQLLFLAIKK